jgi:hypothetical protein
MQKLNKMDTLKKKEDFLAAYELKANNVSLACKSIGIGRSTYYVWMTTDPAFADAIKECREGMVDMAETALLNQMRGGNLTAIIFYLKTQAKDRGYVERQELTGAIGTESIKVTIVDGSTD